MAIGIPTLSQALQALGNGQVFVGDPFTSGGMASIGAKEGAATVAFEETANDLTAPELTGPAVHQRTIMGVSVSITVPVILGDEALYAKINPLGSRSGGHSSPQAITTTSVLLIPNQEVGGGLRFNIEGTETTPSWKRDAGNGVAAATGAAAAPKHAVWLWRAAPQTPGRSFAIESGGKIITPVTFMGMFDAARPEGHKMYTTGDPAAQGIATIRI